MPDEAQIALWKEEIPNPDKDVADALKKRAVAKSRIEEYTTADKAAKDIVRRVAKEIEAPMEQAQIIIHVGDKRYACDLKSHTRVSIKELAEDE